MPACPINGSLHSIGSVSLIILIVQIDKPLPLLNRIGQDTLIINGTHLAFNVVPFAALLVRAVFPSIGSLTLTALLRTAFVLVIEYLVFVPLYKSVLQPLIKYDLITKRFKTAQ